MYNEYGWLYINLSLFIRNKKPVEIWPHRFIDTDRCDIDKPPAPPLYIGIYL